ncbi:MAG: reverse transcriptase family protein [Patescibacteria group bacterium]
MENHINPTFLSINSPANHGRGFNTTNLKLKNLSDLAKLINTPVWFINKLIQTRQKRYNFWNYPKKSGGIRTLSRPDAELRFVQEKIYQNILRFVPLPEYIHSQIGHSHVQHAVSHQGKPLVLLFDIADFFPSISTRMVKNALTHAGFTEIVAKKIANLCTLSNKSTSHGFLPQGTSTSPALATLVATSLDHRLWKLSSKNNWIYTRFADDIAISGGLGLRRAKKLILNIINSSNFKVRESKTEEIIPGRRNKIVGLQLYGKNITPPREYYKLLRSMIHHLQTNKIRGKARLKLRKSIQSRLSYGLYVEKISNTKQGKFFRLAQAITIA